MRESYCVRTSLAFVLLWMSALSLQTREGSWWSTGTVLFLSWPPPPWGSTATALLRRVRSRRWCSCALLVDECAGNQGNGWSGGTKGAWVSRMCEIAGVLHASVISRVRR